MSNTETETPAETATIVRKIRVPVSALLEAAAKRHPEGGFAQLILGAAKKAKAVNK